MGVDVSWLGTAAGIESRLVPADRIPASCLAGRGGCAGGDSPGGWPRPSCSCVQACDRSGCSYGCVLMWCSAWVATGPGPGGSWRGCSGSARHSRAERGAGPDEPDSRPVRNPCPRSVSRELRGPGDMRSIPAIPCVKRSRAGPELGDPASAPRRPSQGTGDRREPGCACAQ